MQRPENAGRGGLHSQLVTAGSLTALTLLISISMLSYKSIAEFQIRATLVAHTYEVLRESEAVLSELKDAETAVRGFVITGDPDYLGPHTSASANIQAHLKRLKQLTADNQAQTERASLMEELALSRMESARQTLEQARLYARPAVTGVLRDHMDAGRARMDELRILVREFREGEEALLAARALESERSASNTTNFILAGSLASLSFLIAAFALLRREIAHRTRNQQFAQQIAEEFEDLYNRAPCGYHSVDRNGVFVRMNDKELEWLGYRRDEVIGKLRFMDVIAPECRQTVAENFPKLLAGSTTDDLEYTMVRKDGSTFPVAVNATALLDAQGRFLMSRTIMFDISALKAAQSRLLEAHSFLDNIIENIPSMIFVKHADSLRFARVNRAEEELLGLSRQEVIGKSDHDLFPKEQADFFVARDREVLAQHDVVKIPEEIITTHSGTRYLQTKKIAVRKSDGAAQFLLGISDDITERKIAEEQIQALNTDLQLRAEQLQAANKELESFSYSVSHDLRSPLRAIDGFSRLLEEDYQETLDEEGRRLLGVIRQNSQRMGQLIDDLLQFSKLGRKQIALEEAQMQSLVEDVLAEVRTGQPDGTPPARINILPLQPAFGDRTLLRQVWVNLIANAVKYSSKSDAPVIEIGSRADADGITYYVKDNGVGFDMRYYDKLFGVFQRLHRIEEFPGTGVGLAIVQRVIARHGGRVWAEAELGKGATFFFTLPERARDDGL